MKNDNGSENPKVEIKWYMTNIGGFMLGFTSAIVLLFLVGIAMNSLKDMTNKQWQEQEAALLQQDIAIVVASKIKEGKTSDGLTLEQLKHYYDNRVLYSRIEKKYFDEKIKEMLDKTPVSH